MEIPNEKQEEHRKIEKAIEAFLQKGGKIKKIPSFKAFGLPSFYEMENEGETEYQEVINEATTTKKGHPWRTFRSVV
tara:strand:+ start:441 stop:671 length:231 start_codon:yes stop_codon:yes gene_type:complete